MTLHPFGAPIAPPRTTKSRILRVCQPFHRFVTRTKGRLLLTTLMATAGAEAGSLQGRVIDEAGSPLEKVPMCLQTPGADRVCIKLQSTDRRGDYRFNGLKPGIDYRVTIFQDDSAAGRKFERFRTYVWEPLQQDISLTSKNETLTLLDFTGKFNFSNFQRGLTLTASDFPELTSVDLTGDYVVLKVYIPSEDVTLAPETIFLGQVADLEKLRIAASLPLSTSTIAYQIYSSTVSIDGFISLSGS